MLNILAAKNKLGFINGTIPYPDPTDPLFSSRSRNNIMVLSWIQQALDHGIKKTIRSSKLASEAWNSLKARYGQGDMIRVAELIESIGTIKQGNQIVSEYYGNLIALQDELDNYQPINPCRCTETSSVDCAALNAVMSYRDVNSIVQFLCGLNDNYATVRSQVLFGDTLPPIDRVFQRALQHERNCMALNKAKPSLLKVQPLLLRVPNALFQISNALIALSAILQATTNMAGHQVYHPEDLL
ncbi:unnamed protein product [Linum trigynum]|uniref:Retrotransposon gag domain-containing protein n=1 Tax=Linum trigynum TaxID=586398 RepID=A0AAV2GQ56_9ROSI